MQLCNGQQLLVPFGQHSGDQTLLARQIAGTVTSDRVFWIFRSQPPTSKSKHPSMLGTYA